MRKGEKIKVEQLAACDSKRVKYAQKYDTKTDLHVYTNGTHISIYRETHAQNGKFTSIHKCYAQKYSQRNAFTKKWHKTLSRVHTFTRTRKCVHISIYNDALSKLTMHIYTTWIHRYIYKRTHTKITNSRSQHAFHKLNTKTYNEAAKRITKGTSMQRFQMNVFLPV